MRSKWSRLNRLHRTRESAGERFYVTPQGKFFHSHSCLALYYSEYTIRMSSNGAKVRGYRPCPYCRPEG